MEFVKIYPNSLSKDLCNTLIAKFEASNDKYPGITAGGLNPNTKKTMDLHSRHWTGPEWAGIDQQVCNELSRKINQYYKDINDMYKNPEIETGNKPLFFPNELIQDSGYQIQRYKANDGKYIFHHDFSVSDMGGRALTFLWYLNDVNEGGHTGFYDGTKVQPETGKLVMFPATWTYVHKGFMPISNDKYIMTGWVYGKKRSEEIAIRDLNQPTNQMQMQNPNQMQMPMPTIKENENEKERRITRSMSRTTCHMNSATNPRTIS